MAWSVHPSDRLTTRGVEAVEVPGERDSSDFSAGAATLGPRSRAGGKASGFNVSRLAGSKG